MNRFTYQPGGSPCAHDHAAKAALAFANRSFPGGLVALAIQLYELARMAEASSGLRPNAFLLRNCARDLACSLALMPSLAEGRDKLQPLVDSILADPVEKHDRLVLQLAAPQLVSAED